MGWFASDTSEADDASTEAPLVHADSLLLLVFFHACSKCHWRLRTDAAISAEVKPY